MRQLADGLNGFIMCKEVFFLVVVCLCVILCSFGRQIHLKIIGGKSHNRCKSSVQAQLRLVKFCNKKRFFFHLKSPYINVYALRIARKHRVQCIFCQTLCATLSHISANAHVVLYIVAQSHSVLHICVCYKVCSWECGVLVGITSMFNSA